MAESHLVIVTYTPDQSPELTIETEKLILISETPAIHSVVWDFVGVEGLLESGWCVGIRFQLQDGTETPKYSGPFLNLCTSGRSVIASGNDGGPGTYAYRAVLQPPPSSSSSTLRSEAAILENEVSEVRSAAIEVRPNPGRAGELLVSPEAVTLVPGQTLHWQVNEEPAQIAEWYPRLIFESGPAGMNPYCGPLASLDTRDRSILGSGNADVPGRYSYRFQMVSVEDDSVLFESSPDPTIDDEGDPGAQGPGDVVTDET